MQSLRNAVGGRGVLLGLLRPPSQCRVCGAWPSHPVCGNCQRAFAVPTTRCPRCALALPLPGLPCGGCVRQPLALDGCLAAVSYAYPWDGLITAFKFQRQPGLAHPLAELMYQASGVSQAAQQADWVVPMPLSHQRLRERGYNQALLLARRLGAAARLRTDLLLRTRDTTAQSSLDRAQRLRGLHDAFDVPARHASRVAGAHILLVDDVMTTGASLHACAQTLRAAGARHVQAAVLARTELAPH